MSNIYFVRVPGKEKEVRAQRVFEEILDENLPNFVKYVTLHIQGGQISKG